MVLVLLPALLAAEASGRNEFDIPADCVGDALRALPIADLLLDERGELRSLVNVYVDGVDMRESGGLDEPVSGEQTVRIVAAIAGGRG
ncbi:MAG: MoaD/ThiS family protein [Actinomycetota bacterium]|nr:MoaD/ThiS family protein [Actinomycetota bacterium]